MGGVAGSDSRQVAILMINTYVGAANAAADKENAARIRVISILKYYDLLRNYCKSVMRRNVVTLGPNRAGEMLEMRRVSTTHQGTRA